MTLRQEPKAGRTFYPRSRRVLVSVLVLSATLPPSCGDKRSISSANGSHLFTPEGEGIFSFGTTWSKLSLLLVACARFCVVISFAMCVSVCVSMVCVCSNNLEFLVCIGNL